MTSNLKERSYRETITQILIYAALLTPLIVATKYAIFPFVFPKVIYFEIIIGLLAAAAIPLILQYSQYRIKNAYTYVIGSYAIVLILAAIFAFDSTRAFWSNFERMTGVIFILFTMAFSLIVASYYSATNQKMKNFLSYAVAVSVIVSLVGLYQKVDVTYLLSQSVRIAGTFGNPIYLGGFAAQFALIAAYLGYANRTTSTKWWYAVAAVINLLAVYLSGTRSALVGLTVAVGIIGIYFSRRTWTSGYKKHIIGIWGAVIIVSSCLLAAPHVFPQLFPESSFATRFLSVSSAVSGTGSTRLIAWKIAIQGFIERPMLGWGPENFYYVFNKYYNPKSLTFGQYETWFDHAHNAVFDVLVTQGLVGFIIYLAQYGVIIWMCYKTCSKNPDENVLSVVLLSIFVLHFVHNLFVFDHPGSYVEFYAFAGIVVARYTVWQRSRLSSEFAASKILHENNYGMFVGATMIAVTSCVVIPSVRQNYYDFMAQSSASLSLDTTQKYFQRAINVNGPHTADVLLDTARIAQRMPTVVNGNTPFLAVPEFKKYFEFAVSNLDRLLVEVEPGSELGALMQGQLLMNAVQFGDMQAARKADAAFRRATELSPDRQQVAYSWSRLKLLMSDLEGAKKLLVEANNKESTIPLGHWYLAILLLDTDASAAVDEIELAAKYGYDIKGANNRLVTAIAYGRVGRITESADLFIEALRDSASQWEANSVQIADKIFVQAQRSEARATLHAKFPEVFNKKIK